MSLIRWSADEGPARGIKAGEVVIFSCGSYSDYSVNRVLLAAKDISSEEFEAAAASAPISQTHPERNGDKYDYLYDGDLVKALIAAGLLREIGAIELHTESVHRYEGGPAINIEFSQFETI